jgi:hypothetical protein
MAGGRQIGLFVEVDVFELVLTSRNSRALHMYLEEAANKALDKSRSSDSGPRIQERFRPTVPHGPASPTGVSFSLS